MDCGECGCPDLPDIAEDEVDNDSHDGDHLEIQLRRDLKVEPPGEIFRLVERHEDDGRAGRHCPGPHDDWNYLAVRAGPQISSYFTVGVERFPVRSSLGEDDRSDD